MIKLKNISKSFGSNDVLKGIDLQFSNGKVYGIVGENGAGKTTLFRCMSQLESHDGDMESDWTPLKNTLGFLPTDPFFFPKITGREYLRLLFNARSATAPDFDEKNIFGLPLNQYASTYSTGMKKKLALLGILLLENDVYILDEPFNGVDIQSNMIITDLIHRLKAKGKTVIISSHIFSTLKDTCDELHLLRDGHIVQSVGKDGFDRLEQEMVKGFGIVRDLGVED